MADQPLWLTLPLPEMHVTQGVAGHMVTNLDRIDAKLSRDWLFSVGVRRDVRNGRSSFKGNDARKLFLEDSIAKLRQLAPPRTSGRKGALLVFDVG